MKNLTKQLLLATCLTTTLGSASFAAEEEAVSPISANVTMANGYIWRGMSQHYDSGAVNPVNKITVSGGFDYDAGNGFAVGIWGSNASWTADMSSEVDYYGSYSGDINADAGYEVGYISYTYPGDKGSNFKEAYVGLSYGDFGLTKYKGAGTATDNLELSYNLDLSGIDTTLTYGDYDKVNKYHSVAFGKSFDGIDYSVSWHKSKPVAAGASERNTIFSISKSF